MIRRTLFACAAIAALATPMTAGAEELLFSYHAPGNSDFPSYAADFSFEIASDPVPLAYALPAYPDPFDMSFETNGYVTVPTVNWQGSIADPGTVTFYSTIPIAELYVGGPGVFADGGLSPILNEYIAAPQIYSGPENAPHFAVGTYDFELGDPAGGQDGGPAFVTISAAVPEPGTWAMMLIGLAAIGLVRRRRVAVDVSYGRPD